MSSNYTLSDADSELDLTYIPHKMKGGSNENGSNEEPNITNSNENGSNEEPNITNSNDDENGGDRDNGGNDDGNEPVNKDSLNADSLIESLNEQPLPDEPSNDNSSSNNEIDINDVEILEDEKIAVFNTEIIPEEKVITTDYEQNNDCLTELMKMTHPKDRNKPHVLKQINNNIKFFNDLKYKSSVIINDNITGPLFKGDYYKKQLNNYLEGNFTDSYLRPIVSETKDLYHVNPDGKKRLPFPLVPLADIDDDYRINKKTNEDEIIKIFNIRDKYKTKSERIKYNYKNEIKELFKALNCYKPLYSNETIKFNLLNDTHVYNNGLTTFNKNEFKDGSLFMHKLLGETQYNVYNSRLVNGETINIKGFVRESRHKLKILELNKNNLFDIINSDYTYNDLYNNLDTVIEETVFKKISIGDTISVIDLNDLTNIGGHVLNETDENYTINPFPEPGEKLDDIPEKIISKNDKNLVIFNTSKTDRLFLTDQENIFVKFLFNSDTKINKSHYKDLLELIIPSTKEILYKHKDNEYDSLDEILDDLHYYNLTLEDITYNNFKQLSSNLKKVNIEHLELANKNKTSFSQFLKKKQIIPKKNFNLIDNNSLQSLEHIYGEYPYYKTSIDSNSTRLNWIKSQPDYGEYFFKSIIKEINKKLPDPIKIIDDLKRQLTILEDKKLNLETIINKEKQQIIAEGNACIINYISKEYTSVEQLKQDNNKEIYVDKDKIRYSDLLLLSDQTDKIPKVPIGSFAILNLPNGKRTIYERIQLATNEPMWVINESINIDNLIISNKDFCNQQFNKIDKLEKAIKKYSCKFSSENNECLTITLKKKLDDLNDITIKISDINGTLKSSDTILKSNDVLELNLTYYQDYIKLVQDVDRKKYSYEQETLEKEEKEGLTSEYKAEYDKIDQYKELVASLSDTDPQKYYTMKKIIEKFGREALPSENKDNIYSKKGNHIVYCKHHELLVDLHTESNPEIYKILIKNYGIENNGQYWCKNCGQHLGKIDFETVEGFTKSGAHQVSSEVIVDDDDEEENEFIRELNHLIDEDGISNDVDKIEYITIVKTLISIMGIKMTNNDILDIIRFSKNKCSIKIKTEIKWTSEQRQKLLKKKKKFTNESLNKDYNNYFNFTRILYTSAYIFVVLQTSSENYIIKNTHSKCKPSLSGFPLDKDDDNYLGLTYIQCILGELGQNDGIWTCLRNKSKAILKNLISILTNYSEDPSIALMYTQKLDNLVNMDEDEDKINVFNEWMEFRPPLDIWDIDSPKLNKINLASEPANKDELLNYYSLKLISEFNKVVNKTDIENIIFEPVLLSQICCSSKVDKYNHLNYFLSNKTEGGQFKQLLKNIAILESYNTNDDDYKLYFNGDVEYLRSFSQEVFLLDDDTVEQQKNITELFVNYIDSGDFIGHKHIYENDICVITGQSKSELAQQIYTVEQYETLLETIFRNKFLNQTTPISFNEFDFLNTVIDESPILNKDITLNNIILQLNNPEGETNKIKTDFIKTLWLELKVYTGILKDEIIKKFDDYKLDISFLRNLGNISSLETNSEKFISIKIELIKNYINYFIIVISKIKNDKSDETIDIPDNWKLSDDDINTLNTQYKLEIEYINEFITVKNTHDKQNLYDLIFDYLIKALKNIRKLYSLEHIYNCSQNIIKFSILTNEYIGILIEYIFIFTLNNIIDLNIYDSPNLILYETVDDEPLQTEEDIEEIANMGSLDEKDPLKFDKVLIYQLVYRILNKVENSRKTLDISQQKLIKNIELKENEKKEKNLNKVRELRKEEKYLLKEQLRVGIVKWNQMSNIDISRYIVPEESEQDAQNEDFYSTEDSDRELRNKALQVLGPNASQDDIDAYIHNESTGSMQAQQEMGPMALGDEDSDNDDDQLGE